MGSTSAARATAPSKPARRGGDHAALPAPEAAGGGHGARSTAAGAAGNDAEAGDPSSSAAAAGPPSPTPHLTLDGVEDDGALHRAEFLSREEVIRRRLRRVRMLARYYRRQYWGLMEAVRVRHRDYYWNFGRSPTRAEGRGGSGEGQEEGGFGNGVVAVVEGSGESGRAGLGFGPGEAGGNKKRDRDRCAFPGCKTKPMALTMYCHLHILSDQKQRLYKGCTFPIKSMHTGPITCGKPVLRARPLSYCPTHIQKAQKAASQALKKAGLSQNSSRPPPKLSVIIAECVRQIQAKRREARAAAGKETVDGEQATP